MRTHRWRGAAVAAVVGVLGAATITIAPPAQAAPQSNWDVTNKTSVPLFGELHGQCGSDLSNANITADQPMQPGAKITMSQTCTGMHLLYEWGRVCYQGHWWNLRRDPALNERSFYFFESSQGLKVHLDGSDDNILLIQTDSCP